MIPNEDNNLAIRKAFGFTLVDLQANQHGELSPRQQNFMDKIHPPKSERGWWLILLIPTLGIIAAIIIGFFETGGILIPLSANLFSILMLLLLVRIGIYMRRANYPLKTREIHVAEGAAEVKTGFRKSKNFYTLMLDKKEFRLIHLEEYQIIQPGARYRIYFIDAIPPIILSLEQIPG